MATSKIENRLDYEIGKLRYRNDAPDGTNIFDVPFTAVGGNRGFIIITRYGAWWGSVYNSAGSVQVVSLCQASDATRTVTATIVDGKIHLVFSGGMYGGISVYF